MLIRPEDQRKGIGTELLRYIVTRSDKVVMSVPNDARIARFYTRHGFQYVFTPAMLRQRCGMAPDPQDSLYFGGMMSTDDVLFQEAMTYGMRYGM
jgi:GNAT superfamily N-acetyltransferase